MGPVRVPRVLSALLLMLVALLLCAGPAVAGGHGTDATDRAVAAVASDCGHPPAFLHAGTPDQIPRRTEDDPPVPATRPDVPAEVTAPGHAPEALPVPGDRVLAAPSPVEQLCVDRN